jgi:hypothetical protein
MYTGSMIGKGAVVFAVMGYVIANMVPRGDGGERMEVELNPKLLAFILGEPEKEVAGAIEMLCSPDGESRSKESDGRRLVRIGQFDYLVVNGAKYRATRDPEKRRQQNKEAQARWRERQKAQVAAAGGGSGKPLPGEREYVRKLEAGEIDRDGMPVGKRVRRITESFKSQPPA